MSNEKKTILMVDDDDDFLLQQKLMLETRGYSVVSANSAREACEIIATNKFDAAVIDLMMENMDSGFVLAHRLKKVAPSMPVIIVTAVDAETGIEFNDQAIRSGWVKADAILAKPVRAEQLATEIARLLQ